VQRFAVGHARGGTWAEACAGALGHLGDQGAGANLGFLYVTDPFADDLPAIRRFFAERTGIAHWLGAAGIGICATGAEYFAEPAVAVMLAHVAERDMRFFAAGDGRAATLGALTRPFVADPGAAFGVLHADPRTPDLQDTVAGLAAQSGAFLIGGLLSSRGRQSHLAKDVVEGGVGGALFSPAVGVATALTQGCTPIGPVHQITAAQGNVVITLDGRPALDVFRETIGDILARDLRRTVGYIFAALPIPRSDRGDYLVRNITGVGTADGVFAIGEMVEVGQSLMFCRRDPESARHDLARMLEDLAKRGGRRARGGLYYTCVARGPNLFGKDSEELKAIQGALGEVPMVGFFGNGEICHDRLYGYTGVLGLFL